MQQTVNLSPIAFDGKKLIVDADQSFILMLTGSATIGSSMSTAPKEVI